MQKNALKGQIIEVDFKVSNAQRIDREAGNISPKLILLGLEEFNDLLVRTQIFIKVRI